MHSKFLFIFYAICFISCGLFKNNSNNKNYLLQDVASVKSVNSKSDWKSNLKLSNEEFDTLTFFVNALKDELPKADTSASHFNIYLKGDVSQIEEYVKRFLFKLKDRDKIKELLSHIKYGRDNRPNVEGRDVNLNVDAKEHYRIERRLAGVFNNYFMLLNPPSTQSGNNLGVGDGPNIDPEDKIFNEIKEVCYEFRS
ncbi:hypothetical protein [Borreliella andersonii]|uniref:hypothetical protein n=1 Tax=Borrelia andersonii TaxID=42109 RepID=UPI003AB73BC6